MKSLDELLDEIHKNAQGTGFSNDVQNAIEADKAKMPNTMRAYDFIPGEVYRFPGKATRYLCKRIHKGREVFFQVIDEQGTPVQTRDEWSGEIISNGMVSFQADLAKMRIEE